LLNFSGLVLNEWLKMSKKRSFFIAYAVMLFTIVGFTYLIWKMAGEGAPTMLEFAGSILSTNGIGQVVTIVAIIFTAGIVAKEHQLGTVKFLLIRAHGRSKILASKYAAALLFVFSLIIFTIASAFVAGGMAFGFEATGKEAWLDVLNSVLFQTVYTTIYVSLTFMFGILTRSSGATIGIGMTAVLLEGLLKMLLASYDFSKYLLFMNTDLSQFAGNEKSSGGMLFPSVVCAAYVALFLVISFVTFKKRDIA